MTSDTSTDAVVKLSKEISALASREAQTMPTGWEDAYWLYAKTADAMLALASERDELRAQVANYADALAAQNNVIDGLKAELDDARGAMTDAYEMAADHRAEPDHGNVRGWIEVHLRETLSREVRTDGQ